MYAMTIYEVSYDVVLTCVLGAIFSVWYLPLSTPILAVSLVVPISWLLFFKKLMCCITVDS